MNNEKIMGYSDPKLMPELYVLTPGTRWVQILGSDVVTIFWLPLYTLYGWKEDSTTGTMALFWRDMKHGNEEYRTPPGSALSRRDMEYKIKNRMRKN